MLADEPLTTRTELYSAQSALRMRRAFVRRALADLRIVPPAAWQLFVRMVQARYRQSLLRWLWLVVPAVVTTVTWVFLSAAGIINHGRTHIPYAAYVGCGTIIWQTFVESLNSPTQNLSRATAVLKSARLPHEAWILAGLLDVMVNLVVRLTLLLVVLVALGALGGVSLLLVPLGLLSAMLLGTGLGLLTAVAGRLYADIAQVVAIGVQFGFFLTPVFYRRTHGLVGDLVHANPMTPVVVSTRAWMTGRLPSETTGFIVASTAAALLVLIGWTLYRAAQPHLVERM